MKIEEIGNKIMKSREKSTWIESFFDLIEEENIEVIDNKKKVVVPILISTKMIKVLKILLKNGATIDKEDFLEYLFFCNPTIVDLLVKNVINLHDMLHNRSILCLVCAMNEKILKKEFSDEIDIEFTDFEKHQLKIVELLLDNGVKISDEEFQSVCLMANLEIVELLLKNGVNPNTKRDEISLLYLILMMTQKMFELIIFNTENEQAISSLISNFEKNRYDIAKLLIRYGASVNDRGGMRFCII